LKEDKWERSRKVWVLFITPIWKPLK